MHLGKLCIIPVTPAQLMRPGIGQNALGDSITSRPYRLFGAKGVVVQWLSHAIMCDHVKLIIIYIMAPYTSLAINNRQVDENHFVCQSFGCFSTQNKWKENGSDKSVYRVASSTDNHLTIHTIKYGVPEERRGVWHIVILSMLNIPRLYTLP